MQTAPDSLGGKTIGNAATCKFLKPTSKTPAAMTHARNLPGLHSNASLDWQHLQSGHIMQTPPDSLKPKRPGLLVGGSDWYVVLGTICGQTSFIIRCTLWIKGIKGKGWVRARQGKFLFEVPARPVSPCAAVTTVDICIWNQQTQRLQAQNVSAMSC